MGGHGTYERETRERLVEKAPVSEPLRKGAAKMQKTPQQGFKIDFQERNK